jgi:hypothetical protein
MRRSARQMLSIFLFVTAAALPAHADPLPALGVDLSRTSVAGLSSGAYMAGQFQIAYSRLVIGAGIVAGGPFGCARTPNTELNPLWTVVLTLNATRAQNNCMKDDWGWFFSSVPDPADLLDYAERLAAAGKIDPLDALKADKVYLFSSKADDTVEPGVVEAAASFYRKAGIPDANIIFEKNDKAAHAFIVQTGKQSCGTAGPPYLNDCDIDQAREILEEFYGPLRPPAAVVEANFLRFEQEPFLAGLPDANFDEKGVAYIPSACRSGAACAVHVVFHGCRQGVSFVQDQFVKGSGYERWAESNGIVLLFPQVTASAVNPRGCWDWWGYTGLHFLERDAPQMLAVRRMLGRLAERP